MSKRVGWGERHNIEFSDIQWLEINGKSDDFSAIEWFGANTEAHEIYLGQAMRTKGFLHWAIEATKTIPTEEQMKQYALRHGRDLEE